MNEPKSEKQRLKRRQDRQLYLEEITKDLQQLRGDDIHRMFGILVEILAAKQKETQLEILRSERFPHEDKPTQHLLDRLDDHRRFQKAASAMARFFLRFKRYELFVPNVISMFQKAADEDQ